MTALQFILLMALATVAASGQPASSQQAAPQTEPVPASCSVTRRPAKVFVPPSPYQRETSEASCFWLGTEKLWTEVCEPMIWHWTPHQPGHEQEIQPLTAKTFWFRVGYDWRSEPQPKLTITGRRIDGAAPPLMVMTWPRRNATPAQATNAIMDRSGRGAMVTGVYVPVAGCWEITGDYEGDKLSFVVWVEPAKPTITSSIADQLSLHVGLKVRHPGIAGR
jgi:hypothetical protein